VPRAALLVFQQIVQDTPDPRARYYIALAKAQNQDFEGALESWADLAADSQPNAPWMQLVRRDIVNMVRFLDKDISTFLPDATAFEIAAAGGAPAQDAGQSRRAELAAALEADPHDYTRGGLNLRPCVLSLATPMEPSPPLKAANGNTLQRSLLYKN